MSASLLLVMLASCAQTDARTGHDDYLDVLAFRSVPDGSEELKDECACLNKDVRRIENFSENMKYSQYAMVYLAKGREQLGLLQQRARTIGCELTR